MKGCRISEYPPDHEIPTLTPEISNTLLHDVILMEVRKYTLKYQAEKKREMLRKEKEINNKIEELIESDDLNDIMKVRTLKEEAQQLEDERQESTARKYFAKLQLEGEKPSKFFCKMNKKQMEKAQFEELHIVEEKEGEEKLRIVTEQKAIEWEVRCFYWRLYQEQKSEYDLTENSIQKQQEEVLKYIKEIKKVSEDDKVRMEAEITEEEVGRSLTNTRNNLSPGHGGYSGDFYKVFWYYLKTIVVNAIREIYISGELPVTLRLGVIALIPKGNKDQRIISNWRPLTLLETMYKLISSTLANRLKPTIDKIVGVSQKAYIPGRYIAECTRNTYDLLTYAKDKNLPGMLMLLDFEKAFDSVSFQFIITTLNLFGFGAVSYTHLTLPTICSV